MPKHNNTCTADVELHACSMPHYSLARPSGNTKDYTKLNEAKLALACHIKKCAMYKSWTAGEHFTWTYKTCVCEVT